MVKDNTPFDSQVIPALHKIIHESGVGIKESLKDKYDILTKEKTKAENSVNKIWVYEYTCITFNLMRYLSNVQ